MEFTTKDNLSQRLRQASLNDAILYHCLMLYKQGDATYQEALEMAVVALVEDRARLLEIAIKMRTLSPLVLPKGVR